MGRRRDGSPLYPDGGYSIRTDYTGESPALVLLRAIAAFEDRDLRDLSSLYRSLDIEALNRLMSSAYAADQDVTVEVEIEDYTAVIRDDGTITVHEEAPSNEDMG